MTNDVSGHLFNVAVQQDPCSHYLYIILFIMYYLCTKFQYMVSQISAHGILFFGTQYAENVWKSPVKFWQKSLEE